MYLLEILWVYLLGKGTFYVSAWIWALDVWKNISRTHIMSKKEEIQSNHFSLILFLLISISNLPNMLHVELNRIKNILS